MKFTASFYLSAAGVTEVLYDGRETTLYNTCDKDLYIASWEEVGGDGVCGLGSCSIREHSVHLWFKLPAHHKLTMTLASRELQLYVRDQSGKNILPSNISAAQGFEGCTRDTQYDYQGQRPPPSAKKTAFILTFERLKS